MIERYKNNMKNPSSEILALAVEMKQNGAPWHQVLNETGLSHSQAEIAYFKATLPKSAFEPFSPTAVVRMRQEEVSWGVIGVRLNVPESKVRAAYKEATGNLSEGQRIGRGGRWLNNDQDLYRDVLQPTGTTIKKEYGRKFANIAASQQRLLKLSVEDLRQLATDQGITTKGRTPAQLIRALTEKLGLLVPGIDDEATKAPAKGKKAKAISAPTPEAPAEIGVGTHEATEPDAPNVVDAEDAPTDGEDVIVPFTIGEKVDA